MPGCKTVVLCFVCLIVSGLSTISWSQTDGAILYTNGRVEVNGQAATDATSVFPGDKVQVPASSSGAINLVGSSVVVSPNSSVQYSPVWIAVMQGGARISTSNGLSASAGQVLVAPKDSAAKFDVLKTDKTVVVVSREGALSVKDGDRTTVVPSGSSSEFALSANSTPAPAQAPRSNAAQENFIASDRLANHPFYGVIQQLGTQPRMLQVCAAVALCIRPSVSKIPPCCCPPFISCNQ